MLENYSIREERAPLSIGHGAQTADCLSGRAVSQCRDLVQEPAGGVIGLCCAAGGEDTATLVWYFRRVLLTIPSNSHHHESLLSDLCALCCPASGQKHKFGGHYRRRFYNHLHDHTINSWTTAWLALAPVALANHDTECYAVMSV